ncbi:helix-turn-helix domain-containing protein [Ligilactobacillus aviarius]|uniref:helix-turn-helix domain-containing protein n=1 Tax=Ligilactobacillus aviarius TaxID=1606 RepID=UPI0024BBC33C|nr:hypothetical protein [Ligilactobacillus aviarius]
MKETLGSRINSQRNALQLSQKKITEKFNNYLEEKNTGLKPITQATFSRWETDRSKPRTVYLKNLANFFKVSVAYLEKGKIESSKELDDIAKANFSTISKQLSKKIEELQAETTAAKEQLEHVRKKEKDSISQEKQNLEEKIENNNLGLEDLILLNSLTDTLLQLCNDNNDEEKEKIHIRLNTFLTSLMVYINNGSTVSQKELQMRFRRLISSIK